MPDPLSAAPPRAGEPECPMCHGTKQITLQGLGRSLKAPCIECARLGRLRPEEPPTRPAPDPTEEHDG